MAPMSLASHEGWQQYRRRMLRETERFIEWGLAHPDEVVPIPTKRVEDGGFPAQVGAWFWDLVLLRRGDARSRRWLGFFRGRRKLDI